MTPPDRMTMIERVARAMHHEAIGRNQDGDFYPAWDDTNALVRQAFLHHARAAIEAMREPTEGMMLDPRVRGDDDIEAWQAMIDAALTEKPL